MGKCTVDNRDDYYRRAKEDGYRARSAYKLLDLDRQFNLLNPSVRRVCDLCAAPGSWSQVLANRLATSEQRVHDGAAVKIVAVDLQRVAPIPNVTIVQGDITAQTTISEILDHFSGGKADLVLCDGAGELSACIVDEYLQAKLVLTALQIAQKIMRPGGTFVGKVLVGDSYRDLVERKLRFLFERVETVKPPSSRAASSEHFAVCMNMLSDNERMLNIHSIKQLEDSLPRSAFPLLANNYDDANGHENKHLDAETFVTNVSASTVSLDTASHLSPADCFPDTPAVWHRSGPSNNRRLFHQFYLTYANKKLGLAVQNEH